MQVCQAELFLKGNVTVLVIMMYNYALCSDEHGNMIGVIFRNQLVYKNSGEMCGIMYYQFSGWLEDILNAIICFICNYLLNTNMIRLRRTTRCPKEVYSVSKSPIFDYHILL